MKGTIRILQSLSGAWRKGGEGGEYQVNFILTPPTTYPPPPLESDCSICRSLLAGLPKLLLLEGCDFRELSRDFWGT